MAKGQYTSKLEENVSQYIKNVDEPKEEAKPVKETETTNQSNLDNIDENKKKKATKSKNKDIKLKVASFHLTPELIEAIRLLSFMQRKKVYETVQELLLKAIPVDILEQAARNVKEFEKNNEDE